jgi:isopentenyl-diphosphate delta-isomerase
MTDEKAGRETEKRKAEHIRIALNERVEFGNAGFDDYFFENQSLPEMSLEEAKLGTKFLGKRLSAPMMITGMSGGAALAESLNKDLATACEEQQIAMGLGSQRAMIEDKALAPSFKVRKFAPSIFLAGNISAFQLREYGVKKVMEALDAVEADALCIHLNPLQEAIQREGDRDWRNCLPAIESACKDSGIPVIVKEVGSGISAQVAAKMEKLGASAVDVSGTGGTSWTAIEVLRKGFEAGISFEGWGIPTTIAVTDCAKAVKIPIIASGGVRSGVHVAKAIALGASIGGAALPFLKAQQSGGSKVVGKLISLWKQELQIAMFATGSKNVEDLKKARIRER